MRRSRSQIKKERIVMLAASAFALTALTVTGVYANQRNVRNQQEGYHLDLSSLEEDTSRQISQIEEQLQAQMDTIPTDDLDVDVVYETEFDAASGQEVLLGKEDLLQLSGTQANPQIGTDKEAGATGREARMPSGEGEISRQEVESVESELVARGNETRDYAQDLGIVTERQAEAELIYGNYEPEIHLGEDEPKQEEVVLDCSYAPEPAFAENQSLAWPIVGNILMDYSMDQAVYFKTLNQYRYNPAIMIEATSGEPITAAADGMVVGIHDDLESGGTICFDLGDGYELTYGQLENFMVKEGEYVSQGQIVGYIAEPSIFFSKEGTHLYFALTKDGRPVDPMGMLSTEN